MDTTVFSLRTSSSRSSLSTRQSSCSSLNRCSNVCSITVRSCRSFVDVSNCAAIMSRSLRRDSAAASTSASLPRQPCAASSRRTMVSEYPTHSAMSSSIFPDSRAFSSPNIAFSFWYLLTSWFLWDARCAAVVSSRILACIFLVSLASLSCISLTSSSARAALARASSSDRLDSRVSETCLSSVSFSASSSCVWRFIKRSASSARDREASASRSSESSVRAPPRSSVSICSSNTSSSRSFFSTEACRSSARMAWYSDDSCSTTASRASLAAISSGFVSCATSIRASSSCRDKSSSAFNEYGETLRPPRKGVRSKLITDSHDTGPVFATKE
mmetsp:Transcript_1124/g.4263  ORF Transcript_1124/g.4263 Transcript_1124/m.4263 type:complete len:330 (+) Transcript_1124:2666-3655(+)